MSVWGGGLVVAAFVVQVPAFGVRTKAKSLEKTLHHVAHLPLENRDGEY